MSKHINIDNEIRLFKDNIESLRITNIFKNRRINIITALIYYTIIIYIYLLTLSVAFFINPMPYEYFFLWSRDDYQYIIFNSIGVSMSGLWYS